jgi:hypothetical protein
MQSNQINRLISRARMAYLRRSDFDGQAPRIADCDVIVRGGRNHVLLMDGEKTIAIYGLRKDGSLRFMPGGRYEKRTAKRLH